MKYTGFPYHIFPLGDTALTINFENRIDTAINEEVLQRFYQLQQDPLPGTTGITPAYCSLTIYYDLAVLWKIIPAHYTVFEWMKEKIEDKLALSTPKTNADEQLIKIPVCYEREMAPDLEQLAVAKNLRVEDVIALHTERIYKVYMLGFLPGFAYLGQVDEKIAASRKAQPQITPEGSVGIAGLQTGIYPFTSPGGWQIIGRTPLKLFKKESPEPVLCKVGNTVAFYSITKAEYEKIAAAETPGY
jgi:inhibitor of KinA